MSLDRKGGIDLAFIAPLYGKPEAAMIDELGELICHEVPVAEDCGQPHPVVAPTVPCTSYGWTQKR